MEGFLAEPALTRADLTKDQVRDAPDYDAARDQDKTYRSELGTYYGPFWWP
jgi:hypothetical protein